MTEKVGALQTASGDYFRKYASMGYVLDILKNSSFYLADPTKWEDQNDVVCISKYMSEKRISEMRAICVTEGTEKYHHWLSYGDPRQLASILFRRKQLEEHLCSQSNHTPSARFGKITYEPIRNAHKISLSELPFVKFNAYEAEQEYRFVLEGDCSAPIQDRLPFSSDLVAGVVVNPWAHQEVIAALEMAVHNIKGLEKVGVTRSTVLEKSQWKAKINALSFNP